MNRSASSMPTPRWSPRRLLTAAAILGSIAGAGGAPMDDQPLYVRARDLKWVDGPPALPPGGKMVVLQGDPSKEGLYTLRSKLPAGYKIPAHWHPTDEHLTVLSGTLGVGMGDKLDPAQGRSMAAGSFISLPAKCHHFVWTTRETVIQVHGMGPFEITYLNPADDPRNRR